MSCSVVSKPGCLFLLPSLWSNKSSVMMAGVPPCLMADPHRELIRWGLKLGPSPESRSDVCLSLPSYMCRQIYLGEVLIVVFFETFTIYLIGVYLFSIVYVGIKKTEIGIQYKQLHHVPWHYTFTHFNMYDHDLKTTCEDIWFCHD